MNFALTGGDAATNRIVLTGATGLIGRALTKALTAQGYEVAALRSRTRARTPFPSCSKDASSQ